MIDWRAVVIDCSHSPAKPARATERGKVVTFVPFVPLAPLVPLVPLVSVADCLEGERAANQQKHSF